MPMDRSKYPSDWEAISRRIRFERAGNKCEWCGVPNYKYVVRHSDGTFSAADDPSDFYHMPDWRASKIVLTVAHIDHDTTNNDDSNLAALCQKCHLTHDAKLHAQHAAETRRRRQVEAGQLAMEV